MNYFLYSDATSTTGKELLAALKEQKVDIIGGSQGPGEKKVGTLVRWGATKLIGKPNKVINNAKSITLASNKLEALKEIAKSDIRIPTLYLNANEVKVESFPVLGRKLHHVGGKDIVLCLQNQDLVTAKKSGCTYFTKYIPTSTEYRVHVFGETVIKVSQKVLTQPELNKSPWIRNLDEGYTFHVPQPGLKLSAQAKGMAIDAVNTLGLTFGAVDLIIGNDGKAYVLEVNTAPGLKTDNSIEVYVEKFKSVIAQ